MSKIRKIMEKHMGEMFLNEKVYDSIIDDFEKNVSLTPYELISLKPNKITSIKETLKWIEKLTYRIGPFCFWGSDDNIVSTGKKGGNDIDKEKQAKLYKEFSKIAKIKPDTDLEKVKIPQFMSTLYYTTEGENLVSFSIEIL